MEQDGKIFLWPKPHFSISLFKDRPTSSMVEKELESLWPGSYPVIFSSARNGIRCILKEYNISRDDNVYLPKYSSHCLFETIARDACPNSDPLGYDDVFAMLHYNQWGMICKPPEKKCDLRILDMADSLPCIGGRVPDAFDFSVVSLPKILGNLYGGVVFCQTYDSANRLRQIRDRKSHPLLNSLLRLVGLKSEAIYKLWHGNESNHLGLNFLILVDIWSKVKNIRKIIQRRLEVQQKIIKNLGFEELFKIDTVCSNLPLLIPENDHHVIKIIEDKVSSGERMFYSKNVGWVRCRPFPLHDEYGVALSKKISGLGSKISLVMDD